VRAGQRYNQSDAGSLPPVAGSPPDEAKFHFIFRSLFMKQYYFTEAGYEKLRKEIEGLERYLKNDIAKEIATAREHGDLRENAEYESAKNKQANYMAKLGLLQERFQNARIIRKSDLPDGMVTLGKVVTIVDKTTGEKEKYIILGDGETDIEKGIISYQSPVAQALMKHRIGDEVEIRLPRKTKKVAIAEIAFYEEF
jgi:transcription elongation factor GreA